MKKIAIIAEYNPFHSGHRYHIAQSRASISDQSAVIVVMSGHWVQQARCAIADKWTRASIALDGGADLVLELPTPYAISSAQGFARASVALLEGLGCVDYLSFGSEAGTLEGLFQIRQALGTQDYPLLLKEALQTGCSFPVARQQAVEHILGDKSKLLEQPNNILALEYLCALEDCHSSIAPLTVPRNGAGFHSIRSTSEEAPVHSSATDIRAKLYAGSWEDCVPYLSPSSLSLWKQAPLPSLKLGERAVLARLASMSPQDWEALPDSGKGEGLPHRLEKYARSANSLEEFLSLAKNKRYTHARLRRLLLCGFLGITQDSIPKKPPYLRILAMNQRGRAVLQEHKQIAKQREHSLPLLSKTAHIHKLSQECQGLFLQEVRCTDLYGLCFPEILPRGLEWRTSPVLKE